MERYIASRLRRRQVRGSAASWESITGAFEPLHDIEFGCPEPTCRLGRKRPVGEPEHRSRKGSEHPEFAVDRMRTLENLPARLLAQVHRPYHRHGERKFGIWTDRRRTSSIVSSSPKSLARSQAGKCGGIDCQTQRSYLLASSCFLRKHRISGSYGLRGGGAGGGGAVFGSSSNTNFRGYLESGQMRSAGGHHSSASTRAPGLSS